MRALALFAVVAACGSSRAPAVPDAAMDAADDAMPATDATNAVIEVMYQAADGTAQLATAGGAVPMSAPPQGGFVAFVGFRAKHIDLASDMLTASLRDTVTNDVVAVEMRPVQLVEGADGWATPADPASMINWANLPTCPAANATRDLFGQPYILRVAVADGSGAQVEATQTIVPTCAAGAPGDPCRCQCKLGYRLGDPCP